MCGFVFKLMWESDRCEIGAGRSFWRVQKLSRDTWLWFCFVFWWVRLVFPNANELFWLEREKVAELISVGFVSYHITAFLFEYLEICEVKSWSVMRHIHTEFVVMGDPGITWSELSEPSSPSLFEHHLHLSLARHPSPEGREGKVQEWQLKDVVWRCRNADTVPVGRDFPSQPCRDHLRMSLLWSLNPAFSSHYFGWK